MGTINFFEDLEIWQLAMSQCSENRKHIIKEKIDELYAKNEILGKKIMAFIKYLRQTEFKGQRYKKEETSTEPQTSNFKPETK
jgi:hypothetical protein